MKPLQPHSQRETHILVNLAPEGTGTMYLKPQDLKSITKKTDAFTEVLYGQQRLRLYEKAERIQSLIDAQKDD